MPLRILPGSIFDVATLSLAFGTAVAGCPSANILTGRRSEFARINAANAGGGLWLTRFELTLPADASVNSVVAAQTNLRASGTFNARLYNAATTEVANVLNQSLPGGDGPLDTAMSNTARGLNNVAMWFSGTITSVRKVALEAVSTDSQHEITRVMAGVYRELAWNFDWGYKLSWVDPTSIDKTYGGDQIATYNGPGRRQLDLPFAGLAEADIRYLFDLVRVIGIGGEVFISAWPGNTANPGLEQRTQMWCRLIEARGFDNPLPNYFGTGLVFEEC